ncbi:MAG: hypothetical protein QOE70_2834 [Chthoniobacter sp.]|nr:hypothetical protein [Chthoniobacter sp.]
MKRPRPVWNASASKGVGKDARTDPFQPEILHFFKPSGSPPSILMPPLKLLSLSLLALQTVWISGCAIYPHQAPRSTKYTQPDRPALRTDAVLAAEAAYDLPDIDHVVASKPKDLHQAFIAFTRDEKFPRGYRLQRAVSDPMSGFKAVLLAPLSEQRSKPLILAFAGTSEPRDAVSDLHFGHDQFSYSKGLWKIVVSNRSVDEHGHPLNQRDLLITGHSLGGGLAQACAFAVSETRAGLHHQGGKVELVTWNGFGGEPLIRMIRPRYDPAGTPRIDYAANYFVAAEPVSEIGTHYGPTYQLGTFPKLIWLRQQVDRHLLHSVRSLLATTPQELLPVNQFHPGFVTHVLRLVPKLDRHFALLNDRTFQHELSVSAPTVAQALDETTRVRHFENPGNRACADYFLSLAKIIELRADPAHQAEKALVQKAADRLRAAEAAEGHLPMDRGPVEPLAAI